MSNYYLFKAPGHSAVFNPLDIDRERITNLPAPLLRATTDGRQAIADLQWEEIGRFQQGKRGIELEMHSYPIAP